MDGTRPRSEILRGLADSANTSCEPNRASRPIHAWFFALLIMGLFIDPTTDFEPGWLKFGRVSDAQADPAYVEKDILSYELSNAEPWVLTLMYNDAGVLAIPLSVMFFESLQSPSVTLFRKHSSSGRVVPFRMSQDDPKLRDPSLKSLPYDQVLATVVTPRFDTELTPYIMNILNEEQMVFLATGMLKVLALQSLNPMMGWGGIVSKSAGGTLSRVALRKGATAVATDAAKVLERLLEAVAKLKGTPLQRFFEVARRLSSVRGLTPQAKADLLVEAAKRLGLEVGGQSVMQGGRVLVLAKDAKTALQVAADGTIQIGRFDLKALDIVNPTAIRPL